MRNIVLTNVGVWFLLLLIFTTVELPGRSLFWQSMQNSGHGLAMCFAAFFGILSTKLKSPASGLRVFVVVPAALLLLSALIEVVQFFSGRDASLADLMMDAAGIAAGTCLSLAVVIKSRITVKALFLVLGLSLLVFCIRMPTYYLLEKKFAPTLPVLANFDNFAAMARIDGKGAEPIIGDHRKVWPRSTANSMMATYSAGGRWPYVDIVEVPKDWSDYTHLSMDVFNAQQIDITLNIRVDYHSANPSEKSFLTSRQVVAPRHSTVKVSFEDLSLEYRGGEPDFSRIKKIMLYLSRPEDETTLYFDNLVLH